MSAKTTAKIVGDALIMDLASADTPSIWRREMSGLAQAGFSVQTKGKKHVLTLTTGDQNEEVASFTDADEAAAALKTITKAFLSYAPVAAHVVHQVGKPFYRKPWFYVLLVLLLGFIVTKNNAAKRGQWNTPTASQKQFMMTGNKTSTKPKRGAIDKGVPVSAEDMFGE